MPGTEYNRKAGTGTPFSFKVFLAVAAGAVFAAAAWSAPLPWRIAIWAGTALLAIVFALVLSWELRSHARKVQRAVGALPEFDSGGPAASISPDFAEIMHALEVTSHRLRQRLAGAQEDRLQLEGVLDSMQDAVVAVDGAGRIQWSNQRMQRLMPGAAVQSTVRVGHALVQTVRDPEVLECVKAALEERTVSERRSTSMMPGRIFEVSASPMPGGGAVAVLHDITRIEQVERTQRDFVANVSHELRTPLTSITGYVETLLDHEEQLSTQAQEFLSTILKNATRMTRLTEDLLILARVESNASEIRPAPVRADALVRDAVDSMLGLVQDEEAELEIGETTPAEVLADTDSMLQVLGNLIENGIKYGKARGAARSRVVVSAREVESQNVVEFSVRDFGQGIASEHLERIFERFYRVDKARSRESGGTGLGLAIARYVVEAQGGTIRAESELNQGSNFLVRLPRSGSTG